MSIEPQRQIDAMTDPDAMTCTIYGVAVLANLTISAKFDKITNSGLQFQLHIDCPPGTPGSGRVHSVDYFYVVIRKIVNE